MKKTHILLVTVLAAGTLAGCAGSSDSQQLSQKTVEYACGPGGEQPLTVQYTFRGDEAVSARVIHVNQTVEMVRLNTTHSDMVGNTFRGGGYTWTTGRFDHGDVNDVDGDMLMQDALPSAGPGYSTAQGAASPTGAATGTVGNILLRDCRVS